MWSQQCQGLQRDKKKAKYYRRKNTRSVLSSNPDHMLLKTFFSRDDNKVGQILNKII